MSIKSSDEFFDSLVMLLDAGDPLDQLAYACYSACTKFPDDPRFWFLSSQIQQKMNQSDKALEDITNAINQDQLNPEFNLQLFNVLLQRTETNSIHRRINWLVPQLSGEFKKTIVGYAKVAIESGLISKFALTDSVLVEVLKMRQ